MAYTITDTPPRVRYTATAGQTAFTIPFEFPANGDIKVYVNEVLLTYSASPADETEYSLTGAATDGGGTATLGAPGATLNDDVLIVRDIPVERLTDFPSSGIFDVEALNDQLDLLTAMVQQLEQQLNKRALVLSATDLPEEMGTLPDKATRASKILGFDANGDPEINETVSDAVNTANTAAGTATAAATTASNAATAALSSQTTASSAASAASASETAAAASEAAAASSETNAASSAATASSASSSATTAKNAAETAQSAAEAAQTAAETALDTFDDTFLGSKASDPTVDNDGDPLVEGQLYWNSSGNALRVYDGAAWQDYSPNATAGAVVFLEQQDISGTPSEIDLTGYDFTSYNEFRIVLMNVVPDTDNTNFHMRYFDSGIQTGVNYFWRKRSWGATDAEQAASSSAFVLTYVGVGNASTEEGLNGEIIIAAPRGGKSAGVRAHFEYDDASGNMTIDWFSGRNTDQAIVPDGFRLFFDGGNMSSGRIALYGVKNS